MALGVGAPVFIRVGAGLVPLARPVGGLVEPLGVGPTEFTFVGPAEPVVGVGAGDAPVLEGAGVTLGNGVTVGYGVTVGRGV